MSEWDPTPEEEARERRRAYERLTQHYPVKATDEPCAGCGKPIQPAQLYKQGPPPRHLGH